VQAKRDNSMRWDLSDDSRSIPRQYHGF